MNQEILREMRELATAEGFPSRLLPELVEAMERHRQTPEIGASDYKWSRRLLLSDEVRSKERLYLDTAWWLRFRDCLSGRNRNQDIEGLLEKLTDAVAARQVVVPVTDVLLQEVFHQSDDTSRRVTNELVDNLSQGVGLVGNTHRSFHEARSWLASKSTASERQDWAPEQLVWTWVPFITGERTVQIASTPNSTELANTFEKVMDDLACSSRFSDVANRLSFAPSDLHALDRTVNRLNRFKDPYWTEGKSYRELFLEECLGYWRGEWELFARELRPAMETAAQLDSTASDDQLREAVFSIVRSAIERDTLGMYLPEMQIISSGNARIITESKRRFKRGDVHDLRHAAIALPYCSTFATDKSLRHLLSSSPSDLAGRFGCKPISRPDELDEILNDVS